VTNKSIRLGVLGSGKGSNCEAIMEAIAGGSLSAQVAVVLSDVADAPILQRAQQRGIAAHFLGRSSLRTKLEPELEQRAVALLQEADVDLVVLAGYMRVVKEPLLAGFGGRIMNIHPSLLPSFPGLRAWEQALNYGAKVTGCTVHFVNEGIDAGPIILQEPVPILTGDTPASLHQRIQVVEHKLYPEAIRLFAAGKLHTNGRHVDVLP